MATEKQKAAARRNLEKARAAQRQRAKGTRPATRTSTRPSRTRSRPSSQGLTTAEQNRLPDSAFAFPDERKEPLVDASHVRNAIARFDQVEDVTDAERDRAWRRILRAAKKFDVEVSESGWRELFEGGKARKKR